MTRTQKNGPYSSPGDSQDVFYFVPPNSAHARDCNFRAGDFPTPSDLSSEDSYAGSRPSGEHNLDYPHEGANSKLVCIPTHCWTLSGSALTCFSQPGGERKVPRKRVSRKKERTTAEVPTKRGTRTAKAKAWWVQT